VSPGAAVRPEIGAVKSRQPSLGLAQRVRSLLGKRCHESAGRGSKRIRVRMQPMHKSQLLRARSAHRLAEQRKLSRSPRAKRRHESREAYGWRDADAMHGVAEGCAFGGAHDVASGQDGATSGERRTLHLRHDHCRHRPERHDHAAEPVDERLERGCIVDAGGKVKTRAERGSLRAQQQHMGVTCARAPAGFRKGPLERVEHRSAKRIPARRIRERDGHRSRIGTGLEPRRFRRLHAYIVAHMEQGAKQVWLVRHADTEWSKSGRHTGTTDLPLLPEGEQKALGLGPMLSRVEFSLALSSPRSRAIETARLAGFGTRIEVDPNLAEFDYGEFEGLTSAQIHEQWPGWDLWRDGCPGGETPDHVASRCTRLVQRCLDAPGNAVLFGHGHIFHAFAAAWLELPASRGRSFGLKAGSVSVLGFEHGNRVLWQWDRVERLEGH